MLTNFCIIHFNNSHRNSVDQNIRNVTIYLLHLLFMAKYYISMIALRSILIMECAYTIMHGIIYDISILSISHDLAWKGISTGSNFQIY